MPGLIVTLRGSSAEYDAMMARSIVTAKATAIAIQREYATAQKVVYGQNLAAMNPLTFGRSAASTINNATEVKTAAQSYGEWWTEALGKQEKAAWAANAAVIAAGVSAGGLFRGHGGGIAGIIRESIVIMREVMMGRGGGRIAGSVTLLAQYLGLLNLAVKSTAATAVVAAAAEKKLAVEMAIAAARAKGTAAADALLAEAQTQAAISAQAQATADEELAVAQVTLNPIFFIAVGLLIAVAGGAYLVWRHFRNAAIAAKNWADAMNPLKKSFTELADAEEKAAKARQEHADEIKKITDLHKSESDQIERKIKLLKMEAEARGWTDAQTLARQKALLETEKARLEIENQKAVEASKSASDKDLAGGASLDNAHDQLTGLKAIADAAQAAMESGKVMVSPGGYRGAGMSTDATYRPANESDILDFKVGNKTYSKTFAEVKAAFDEASARVRKLTVDQKALDDAYSNALSTQKDKQDALNKVIDDLADIADQQKFPAGKRHGGGGRMDVTERERIGLGAASSVQVNLLDVSRKIHNQQMLATAALLRIDKNIASEDW